MMKKLFALALSGMMAVSLAACGGSKPAETTAAPAAPAETTAAAAAETTAAAAETTAAEAAAAEKLEGFSGSYLMGTGSATGNYYAFGNALSTVVNRVTGANLTVNATGGSTENARLLGSGENEFALIQSDVFSYAHQGVELFDGNPVTNFQAVTAAYPEMVQIIVRKDANINSVTDMKGKNICVGAVGSGYEVAFLCSGYPNSNMVELSLNHNIEFVSIDDDHMKILLEKYPFYSEFAPETDEYDLGHPIKSVAVKSMLVCLDTFTEDEIYALTKAIYENLPDIQEINAKANYMSLDSALSGIPSDLHPGARKYYEEQGVTIPDYLK